MGLKKLGFWQAVAVGLGNIVGAGIFVMAGAAINAAGPGALVAFGITAALAASVGLNSAELSSKFPDVEGGVYSFTKATLGDTLGFLVGWFRLISYAVSGAAVALGFSGYMVGIGVPSGFYFPLAALLILILSYVEVKGIRLAAEAEEGLVIINLVGLGLFVATAIAFGTYSPSKFFPVFPNGTTSVFEAAAIAFFAYSGFNTIATLTPDVEKGERAVPRAIILSLVISTLLYALVVFSMLYGLNWDAYGVASNPLSLTLSSVKAPAAISYAVAFSALTATLTVTLSLIIAGSRTAKRMGEDDLLPRVLGKNSKIPTIAVAVIMISSLGLGDVKSIALVANFGVIFSYMLSGIEVALTRKRRLEGKFLSPGYPFTQVFSVALSAIMLLTLGSQSLAVGTATLIIGLLIHSSYKHLAQQKSE
jgi:APA family basic amino acid/polyamine antiporter